MVFRILNKSFKILLFYNLTSNMKYNMYWFSFPVIASLHMYTTQKFIWKNNNKKKREYLPVYAHLKMVKNMFVGISDKPFCLCYW